MIDVRSLAKRMSHLKYFKGLPIGDVRAIIGAGHIKKMRVGTVIVMEEAPNSGLFVLLSGQVHLYRLGPDGQEVLVDILTPITLFNEVAILDGGPNPFTVTAAKDCLVWNADYDVLVSLFERFPQVALGFLPVLAARTRVLISMMTDICFLTVRARVAKLILELSDYGRQSISRQDHTIYKMATQMSTVPEAVSRALGSFRDAGYIKTSRSEIVVCQPDKLAQIAQVEDLSKPLERSRHPECIKGPQQLCLKD